MKRIYQFLWLLFLTLFSLGQLQRFQLTPQIAIYGHDLVLSLWFGLSLITHFSAWRQYFNQLKSRRIYLFFIFWVILGLIINFDLHSILFMARLSVYLLTTLSLTFIKPFTLKKQRWLWLGVGLLIAAWGLIQYFLLPDTRFLRFLGWDDHYYRLISTLFDPNFTGLILIMTYFLVLSFKQLKTWRLLLTGCLLLALALTYSRASYLSFIASSLLLIVLQNQRTKKFVLTLGILLLLASLPFLPRPGGAGVNLTRTHSVTTRTTNTQHALAQLKPHQWLLGRGWFKPSETAEAKPLADTAHFPDNLLVFQLTSTGLIGLCLSLFILYRWGNFLYENDIYIFSAFIAVIIHSQVNHSLFQPFIFLYLLNLSFLATKGES